jgi:hypothetical protein
VREIKEKLCYVAYNATQERALAEETTVLVEEYTLPDGYPSLSPPPLLILLFDGGGALAPFCTALK